MMDVSRFFGKDKIGSLYSSNEVKYNTRYENPLLTLRFKVVRPKNPKAIGSQQKVLPQTYDYLIPHVNGSKPNHYRNWSLITKAKV